MGKKAQQAIPIKKKIHQKGFSPGKLEVYSNKITIKEEQSRHRTERRKEETEDN